jgi:predicted deacetylase
MNSKPAQYLLRFDDLCPTMSPARWQRFLPLLAHYKIKPILAIIPDNQDPTLNFAAADPDFWQKMREQQAAGAAIALHGFRHKCTQHGRSLLPLHRHSEFAGAPEDQQREWIRSGISILRNHGLNPRLFVAPRHGFDRTTLRVLKQEGIEALSDGFAHRPYLRDGITWIPQQLWAPVDKPSGLWTICLHTNSTSTVLLAQLEAFLKRNAEKFTTVDRVLADYPLTRINPLEALQSRVALLRIQLRKFRKSITK